MDMKLFGGILLIVGTAIGAGMLALPIAISQEGFVHSTILLFICWFIMTASAFLILEVNLWLPKDSNIISMAKATLGKPGQFVAWVTYLLLLYSLLAAYIAGGGDFLTNLLDSLHIDLSSRLASIAFVVLLGSVVAFGIRSVDLVNRVLMMIKLSTFFFVVLLILPHIKTNQLSNGTFQLVAASITVAITSFGFATIVPSLRSYFDDDVKKLHRAILIGSLIPLTCYILWDIAIMGIIPREGEGGLIAMLHSGRSTSDFVNAISILLHRSVITAFAHIFSSICLATSFLGVALGLSHFLSDGLCLSKNTKHTIILHGTTFLPPLLIVLFYPGIFISALSYAGVYCVILLALLPALMAWSGRYCKKIAHGYRVVGGKSLLVLLILASAWIIGDSLMSFINNV